MTFATSLIYMKQHNHKTLFTITKLMSTLIRPLYSIVLCFLMTAAQADGLFDFQMKLAKKGNAAAQYKIGEMYETGFGVEKNMEEAAKWIIKSAKKGNEAAKFKLLYWDIQKKGITLDNKDRAKSLKRKAKEGNEYAQYYLGMMYVHGVGAREKPVEGLKWLNKAALAGVQAAESEIATAKEAVRQAEIQKKQAELKKQRTARKKRAEQDAKRQKKERARLEIQRREGERRAAEKAFKAREAKAREEKARQTSTTAVDNQRRTEKQERQKALLKAQAERDKEHKEEFESDPCSGKSARFLSTCR